MIFNQSINFFSEIVTMNARESLRLDNLNFIRTIMKKRNRQSEAKIWRLDIDKKEM